MADILDEHQERSLLSLARETMRCLLSAQPLPSATALPEQDEPYGGAFVTLRNRGRLRGCMGRFHPEGSLAETVQTMALHVLDDPRFRRQPVTLDELPRLTIEISVLSAMERTTEPARLVPGTHGIYVRRGQHSGCFLPQVATEHHWNAEQLLSKCCELKAGLPADAWREPGTEVSLFTSHMISE